MQREKIKPVIDVPMVLLMETVYGEESQSKFTGVEYLYNVIHEGRPAFIYLPAEGRDAILRAEPQPGDYIELVKQKRNGRIHFAVQLCTDAIEPPPPPPPQRGQVGSYQQAVSQPVSQQQRPVRVIPPPPPSWEEFRDEPAPQPRRLAPPEQQPNGQYRNGQANGYHGQAQPPRPEAREVHPITQQMAGCLRWSFDAWEELRTYAMQKGRNVEYSSEDIRATANTLYMRGGSR